MGAKIIVPVTLNLSSIKKTKKSTWVYNTKTREKRQKFMDYKFTHPNIARILNLNAKMHYDKDP